MSYIFKDDDKPPPRRASSFADTIQVVRNPYRAKGLDEQGRYPEAAEPKTGPLTEADLDRAIADRFPGGRTVRPQPAEASTDVGAEPDEPANGRVVPMREGAAQVTRVVFGILAAVFVAIVAGALISTIHMAFDPSAIVAKVRP